MKILHLADLHIGKRVNGFSMIEDQEYILNEILKIIIEKSIEVVLIAGDVYDKTVPSAEAVAVFDDFLARLSGKNLQVFVISGNHDCAERIAFGGKIMSQSKVYMSPVFTKDIKPIIINDDYGEINVYLLPFIKPIHVRVEYKDEVIENYNDAVKLVISNLNIDKEKRNILVAHQFISGSERSDSEEISVGGTENVAPEILKDFDYVALGHLHKAQKIVKETIRYSGTPLKYSISEANHKKSVTIIEMNDKNDVNIELIPLKPIRDIIVIKGEFETVTSKEYYGEFNLDDYFHITLTDEQDVKDAMNKLRMVYKNLMKLDYDNTRTKTNNIINNEQRQSNISPFEIASEFYEKQNNQQLTNEQAEYLQDLMNKIWGKDK